MGLNSWQSLAGLGNMQDDPFSYWQSEGASRQWEMMREFYQGMMPKPSGAGMMPQKTQLLLSQTAAASPVLTQAGMLAAASAMRYWSSLAELFVRYQSALVKEAVSTTTTSEPASATESRVHADELRAFLRGVGEAALKESRRFQYELEMLGEVVAQATDQATPSQEKNGSPRRHEVKP